jgi:hypothetical protein
MNHVSRTWITHIESLFHQQGVMQMTEQTSIASLGFGRICDVSSFSRGGRCGDSRRAVLETKIISYVTRSQNVKAVSVRALRYKTTVHRKTRTRKNDTSNCFKVKIILSVNHLFFSITLGSKPSEKYSHHDMWVWRRKLIASRMLKFGSERPLAPAMWLNCWKFAIIIME